MRWFLQADGRGERIDPQRWPAVAPLIGWPLEPAWDHLFLIRGFELGTPYRRDDVVEVEVKFTVLSEVRSSGVRDANRVDTRRYRLEHGPDGGWRLGAPAPPPYLFASEVDPETMRALLAPDSTTYMSNSAFVWRMLHDAGWFIAYAPTTDLATSSDYTTALTPRVGDLALFYDGETPYHVGLVESEDTIVSATLNGGIQRSLPLAFAGEVRYRRPAVAMVEDTPTPTPRATPRSRKRRRSR